jgi:hypothetical protein
VSGLQLAHERDERAIPAACRRSSNKAIPERFGRLRHHLSVAMLTDQNENALPPMVPEQREQMSMPKSKNERAPSLAQIE